MHSAPLGEDEAALFIFPRAERHAFWNRNVGFPIDVAYLDDAMRIVDVQHLDAHQEEPVAPRREARFVIEASRGTFKRLGCGEGDLAVLGEGRSTVTLKRVAMGDQRHRA
jgi:uncharacterized membrane protein (UPF0127 family)